MTHRRRSRRLLLVRVLEFVEAEVPTSRAEQLRIRRARGGATAQRRRPIGRADHLDDGGAAEEAAFPAKAEICSDAGAAGGAAMVNSLIFGVGLCNPKITLYLE